jgi:heptaprenyl diphosphate synthase
VSRKRGNDRKINTTAVAALAMLTALALGLYTLERLLPPAGLPGVKYGLPNIITLLIIYCYTGSEKSARTLIIKAAFAVWGARVILAALITGAGIGLLFSAAGGIIALCVSIGMKRLSVPAVIAGMAGGIAHNIGQTAVAVMWLGGASVLYYLPMLILGGFAAGLLTGAVARLLLSERLPIKALLTSNLL